MGNINYTEKTEITGVEFVARIDSLLSMKGLSRQKLADACGFSVSNIGRWKSLGALPDIRCGVLIADFLNVPVNWLITGIDKKTSLSPDEMKIADKFSKLDDFDRGTVEVLIDRLLERREENSYKI